MDKTNEAARSLGTGESVGDYLRRMQNREPDWGLLREVKSSEPAAPVALAGLPAVAAAQVLKGVADVASVGLEKGWKSSEFQSAVAFAIGGAGAWYLGVPAEAIVTVALPLVGYILQRGWVKSRAVEADARVKSMLAERAALMAETASDRVAEQVGLFGLGDRKLAQGLGEVGALASQLGDVIGALKQLADKLEPRTGPGYAPPVLRPQAAPVPATPPDHPFPGDADLSWVKLEELEHELDVRTGRIPLEQRSPRTPAVLLSAPIDAIVDAIAARATPRVSREIERAASEDSFLRASGVVSVGNTEHAPAERMVPRPQATEPTPAGLGRFSLQSLQREISIRTGVYGGHRNKQLAPYSTSELTAEEMRRTQAQAP